MYVRDAQKVLEARCLNDWKAHRRGSHCSTCSDLYSLLAQTLMWMHLHRLRDFYPFSLSSWM